MNEFACLIGANQTIKLSVAFKQLAQPFVILQSDDRVWKVYCQ